MLCLTRSSAERAARMGILPSASRPPLAASFSFSRAAFGGLLFFQPGRLWRPLFLAGDKKHTTSRHSGAPRSGEPGSHIPEAGVHRFRASPPGRSRNDICGDMSDPLAADQLWRAGADRRLEPGLGIGAAGKRAEDRQVDARPSVILD